MYNNLDPIIFDYLSGELSKDNRIKFEELLNDSEELQSYYKQLEGEYKGSSSLHQSYDIDAALLKFKSRTTKPNIRKISPLLKVAASLALIISLSSLAYYLGYNHHADGTTTITCDRGDKAQLMLPDGSQVYLNSESSLSYKNSYQKGERNISLTGEATFKVISDKSHPFTVTAQGISIIATGTHFNVMAYAEDQMIRTALLEGVVSVTSSKDVTTMRAGQVVSYNKTDNTLQLNKHLKASELVAWQKSELNFDNETLQQVVNQMQRYYNVQISLDKNIANKRFSGKIHNETIDQLLIILKNTLGIDVEKKDDMVYLNQKKSAS
ncbi:FecR family protein [Saccharicrinis aurantiacus]|uniref:FecR family protein n=1 Tax=Saccharicrinis aurantiacus TaxID=1849719 RepID=UPI0024906AEC|nr:FecR domain-containing protein [Saccharicrinis aurantiacus]